MYAALICRISKDKSGRVEGVRNQEKWGRAYAASTWPDLPVRVFADNDLSAADDTYRPEFEAFREALGRGEVAQVWAGSNSPGWSVARLSGSVSPPSWTPPASRRCTQNATETVRVRDEVAGIKAVLAAGEVRKLKKRGQRPARRQRRQRPARRVAAVRVCTRSQRSRREDPAHHRGRGRGDPLVRTPSAGGLVADPYRIRPNRSRTPRIAPDQGAGCRRQRDHRGRQVGRGRR